MDKLYNFFVGVLLCCCLSTTAFAQTTITGTVRDAKGLVLPGVSVKIKDTKNVSVTDVNGKYTIQSADRNAVLVFTYLGFLPKELSAAGKTTLNVTLDEDSQGLNEVVVVGYGAQKKVNLTGAVSVISGEQLVNKPVPSALAALQGVSPGVTVTRGSGKPGEEGYGIRIRGFSSANNTSALVLVDGVEMDLGLINSDDVESISVLKDAAAASIYGARAAGGVVLVTTKKSTAGKTRVNFSSNYSLNITARQPERLNSWDEQSLIDEARFNATGAREFTAEQIEWLKNPNFDYRPNLTADRWEYFDNTNWIKEGMDKVNPAQNYSLSVGAGKQELNYLLSAGYYKRQGVLRYGPDNNARTNLRLSVNNELNKYMTLNVTAGYINNEINQNSYATNNIIDLLYRVRTRQGLYTPAEDITGQPYNGDLQLNPIDIEKNAGTNNSTFETFTGKASLNVKNVVKGLSMDLTASRNQSNFNSEVDSRTLNWYGRTTNTVRFSLNTPNSIALTKNKGYQDNLTGQLNYELSVGKHNFKVLGGASYEQYRKDEVSAGASTMVTNDFF
ncbi:MAG: SusC/RagA family TonB-linked outer membrane protein, partial [Pedobacter sp.]